MAHLHGLLLYTQHACLYTWWTWITDAGHADRPLALHCVVQYTEEPIPEADALTSKVETEASSSGTLNVQSETLSNSDSTFSPTSEGAPEDKDSTDAEGTSASNESESASSIGEGTSSGATKPKVCHCVCTLLTGGLP
jgi:hypothetical protein